VFFIDKDTADGKEGRNVFVASTEADGSETITSARTGRIEWRDEQQFLVLSQGQRLEQRSQPDGTHIRISDFEEYGVQVGGRSGRGGGVRTLKSVPTIELIQQGSPAQLGELGWRVGLCLTAVNFVFLALAVSASNPRVGRSGNLLFMLFAFITYYNLLNLGQSWVATGRVGLLPFMIGLHGTVLALSLLWLAKRHHNFQLWPLLRRGGGVA
jgi:lipopolysaccharide export system permease protein